MKADIFHNYFRFRDMAAICSDIIIVIETETDRETA